MGLHWDISEIKNFKEVCYTVVKEDIYSPLVRKLPDGTVERKLETPAGAEILLPFLDGLIWSTISVGLSGITKKNVAEFAFRLEALAKSGVPLFTKGAEPAHVEIKDLLPFVGLKVNVTSISRVKFLKGILKDFESTVEGTFRKEKEELEKQGITFPKTQPKKRRR